MGIAKIWVASVTDDGPVLHPHELVDLVGRHMLPHVVYLSACTCAAECATQHHHQVQSTVYHRWEGLASCIEIRCANWGVGI